MPHAHQSQSLVQNSFVGEHSLPPLAARRFPVDVTRQTSIHSQGTDCIGLVYRLLLLATSVKCRGHG
jgi:hypothetical protein